MPTDKTFILNELKKHKNFASNVEFANFLQISPQNLVNWYRRNTFDVNLLANLFTDVNKAWLLTGEGEMLRSDNAPTSIVTPIYSNLENLSVIGHIDIPDIDRNQLVVQYNGGSMSPTIERGNYLAIKLSSGEFTLWGHIYIVITDALSVVGRIHQLSEDLIAIKFDSHNYADISIPRSCVLKTYIVDSVISIKKLI